MFDFEKFPVYTVSQSYYEELCQTIFENKKVDSSLKNQLRRASSSITLNIAEGAGKYGPNDKKNFYTIARGSTNECMAIMELIRLEKKLSETDYQKLRQILIQINKMLSGLINSMNSRLNSKVKS